MTAPTSTRQTPSFLTKTSREPHHKKKNKDEDRFLKEERSFEDMQPKHKRTFKNYLTELEEYENDFK